MTPKGQNPEKIKIGFGAALRIVGPYVKKKVLEQVRSVALIVLYLIFFQTLVLRIQIVEAATIAIGLAIVIGGLTLFMEGLILGLMPLGEVIGVKLPEKTNVGIIMVFAFVLGLGATFAEPAIGILKSAGEGVKPWEAPLLFFMLNTHADHLVYAVGIGVGVAVVFGMLRYLYGWSLKPFIYILVTALVGLTAWAYTDPNLSAISGLAWDCGGVTTGPVTVPLVLALGIGVCRVVSMDDQGRPHKFFYMKKGNRIEPLPFDATVFDPDTKTYTHIPVKGPLFGRENGLSGILVVLLFALVMGYGATLAEPALNALGLAVEEITVGVFKKSMLMHAVAFGVGTGIALGVLKIIMGIPLVWLLAPPYLLLLVLTKLSTEEFVNISWDSAGVTTGPVTVPLVLAMGLGVGNQVGVTEGFGILAMASVCPILTVLAVGFRVSRAQQADFKETATRAEKERAAAA